MTYISQTIYDHYTLNHETHVHNDFDENFFFGENFFFSCEESMLKVYKYKWILKRESSYKIICLFHCCIIQFSYLHLLFFVFGKFSDTQSTYI